MKRILMILPLCLIMTHTAYAGFSVGMPGAVINRAKKLDDKVKAKKQGETWVLVPGNLSFGTSDFYVMAYEAKNIGGVATSQADSPPWNFIDLPAAVAACAALGGGAHLITFAEAQTINRNIEAQPSNWADGVIGSSRSNGGGLKGGNGSGLDNAGYMSSKVEFDIDRDPRAKLTLSNGGIIWDWSGNVAEWIYGTGAGGTLGTPGGVTFDSVGTYSEWNSAGLGQERTIIGPSSSAWNASQGVGLYTSGATANPVNRGGSYSGLFYAGVYSFNAGTSGGYTLSSSEIGFRCAR